MPLTDTAVRSAKPRESAYKMSDSTGLYLFVPPSGSKLWRLDYRFSGKRKTLTLGKYPFIGLAEARRARDDARLLLEQGVDPSQKRKLDRLAASVAAGNTLSVIAEEWMRKAEREGRAPATLSKNRWLLSLALPILGNRPISDITAPELLLVLRKAEARGCYETAKRMRSLFSRIFRYAIATGRAGRDPSADLLGALTAPKVTHRAALTAPAAIGALLRAIDGYQGSRIVKAALRLLPLVFVRPGELRHAVWSEFDFEAARWTIPASRMKMHAPHVVPLSRQALEFLAELQVMTGDGAYLFPSNRTTTRAMSENTVNAALRRLGYSKDKMTVHGFRSMASTRLNEMGDWNPDAIERQLAHGERNQVRAAYNHAQYLPERTRMMQAWADYLDELRSKEMRNPELAGIRGM